MHIYLCITFTRDATFAWIVPAKCLKTLVFLAVGVPHPLRQDVGQLHLVLAVVELLTVVVAAHGVEWTRETLLITGKDLYCQLHKVYSLNFSSMVVPLPGDDSIEIVACISFARLYMFFNPLPFDALLVSNPLPLSLMISVIK